MTDCKTTTKYVVYRETADCEDVFDIYDDLPTARAAASNCAKAYPGREVHVAAHLTTFCAETVVKEV